MTPTTSWGLRLHFISFDLHVSRRYLLSVILYCIAPGNTIYSLLSRRIIIIYVHSYYNLPWSVRVVWTAPTGFEPVNAWVKVMCLGRLAKGLYYFVGLANVVNQPITDKTYYIIFSNICQELFYFIFIVYFIRWALHPHTLPCSGCRVSYLAQQKIGCFS